MSGKYTSRIEQLLKEKEMRWKHLGISNSTLDRCKKSDRYSSEQFETIANALGITVSELTDVERQFDKVRDLVDKVDDLKCFLDQEMDGIRKVLKK